jgi:hypothetical protein
MQTPQQDVLRREAERVEEANARKAPQRLKGPEEGQAQAR